MSWRTQAVVVAVLMIAAACSADRSPTPSTSQPPISGTSGPSPSESVTPTPSPPDVRDIGIGTDVCDPRRRAGIDFLGDGVLGAAWTGQLALAGGRCPDYPWSENSRWIVAVDVTGDRLADSFTGIRCPYGCDPYPSATTDLNGDGRRELIVNVQPFSIMDYWVFVLTDDGGLAPATVGDAGHPANGFDPGLPAVFTSGGDEGSAGSISCTNWPGPGTRLTQINTYHPVDSPKPMEVHVTTVILVGTTFQVVERDDYELDPDVPFTGHTVKPTCGVDWYVWDNEP